MKFVNFIKDFIARKKLIRLHKPWSIRSYDLRRELAIFWDTPAYMPENSNKEQYEQLVAVNGLGGLTGSGAVCDFLREFDECTVLGGAHSSKNEKHNHKKCDVNEFFYWAEEGSVVSLEQSIFSPKLYYARLGALEFSIFVLRNLHSGIWIFDDYYLQRSKKFLFDLIDCHWRWSLGCWSNFFNYGSTDKIKSYTSPKFPKRIEYDDPQQIQLVCNIWRDMSLKEYRSCAKKYFEDWLKHLPSKKFLVLDQALNIGNFDAELFSDYFGDIKMIFVWRDPRDQYERVRNKNLDTIPIDPMAFSIRYKRIAKNILGEKHPNLLIIRFEELVTEYDRVTKQIIDFLGLDPAKHTKKFYYFDPKISAKKIGIHKTYHDQEAIKIIERELKEYCWNC